MIFFHAACLMVECSALAAPDEFRVDISGFPASQARGYIGKINSPGRPIHFF